jgi:multisubunit Na+/H+ antiporter MnhB subunit
MMAHKKKPARREKTKLLDRQLSVRTILAVLGMAACFFLGLSLRSGCWRVP